MASANDDRPQRRALLGALVAGLGTAAFGISTADAQVRMRAAPVFAGAGRGKINGAIANIAREEHLPVQTVRRIYMKLFPLAAEYTRASVVAQVRNMRLSTMTAGGINRITMPPV